MPGRFAKLVCDSDFSVRVEELDAEKMTVTLDRLKDDCDPCLFVRRGAKPTQEVYDKCTYATWSANERQHVSPQAICRCL